MNLNLCWRNPIMSKSLANPFCSATSDKIKPAISQIDRQALAQTILEVRDQLPEPQKNIFIMYHYQGMPVEEIATKTKLSCEQIKWLLDDGSKNLFSQLRNFPKR